MSFKSSRAVLVDGTEYASLTLAAKEIGCTLGNLCMVLRAGKTETKGHQVAYAPVKPVPKVKPQAKASRPPKVKAPKPEPKVRRPVYIDGKMFTSKLSASVELACEVRDINIALKSGGLFRGHHISQEPPVFHHRLPIEIVRHTGPLLIEPVTHRLGVYSGGPV